MEISKNYLNNYSQKGLEDNTEKLSKILFSSLKITRFLAVGS